MNDVETIKLLSDYRDKLILVLGFLEGIKPKLSESCQQSLDGMIERLDLYSIYKGTYQEPREILIPVPDNFFGEQK